LNVGDVAGPSRFWYVVPRGLVNVADVPAWAGLAWAIPHGDGVRGWINVVKEAPRLHGRKVAKVVLRHAINCCYWRFWDERHEVARLRHAAAQLKLPAIAQRAPHVS